MTKYRSGYKFQLHEMKIVSTGIFPNSPIETRFIKMNTNGTITIMEGYAWDGATGAWNTKNLITPSLVHDALYQLIRTRNLGTNKRRMADNLLKTMCLNNGMTRFRAWYIHRAVTELAAKAANPVSIKIVKIAP